MSLDRAAYQELKNVASYYMGKERAGHTLCPTALVNEAFLKYHKNSSEAAQKVSFMAIAARSMRQILVSHAREKNALKRGGGQRTLIVVDDQLPQADVGVDILNLDDALSRLAERHPLQAQVIELRYFSGMSHQEVADTLGISLAMVKRKWTIARAWLFRDLNA